MLKPRIWVFYDENWGGWSWDVATKYVSSRSARYNPYDTAEEAMSGGRSEYISLGGSYPVPTLKVFDSPREYVQAQIARDYAWRKD